MSYYLFDSPRLVILIALCLQVLLLIGWMINRERIRTFVLLVGPLLAGVGLLLDLVVQTPREALEERTRQLVSAIAEENANVVVAAVDPTCRLANGMDATALCDVIRRYLRGPLIDSYVIKSLEVIEGYTDRGQVEFSVLTLLDSKGPYAYVSAFTSKWRIGYRRENRKSDYTIVTLENLEINGQKPDQDVFRL